MKKYGIACLLVVSTVLLMATGASAQESSGKKGFIGARELAESLGLSYQYYPMQKMAQLSKGGKTMRLFLEKTEATVDNKPFALPGVPNLQEGEVFVPARAIIQVFGSQPEKQPAKPKTEPAKPKVEPLNRPDPENQEDPDEPDLETPAIELSASTPAGGDPENKKPGPVIEEASPKPAKPIKPNKPSDPAEPGEPAEPPAPKLLPPTEPVGDDDEMATLTDVRHSKRDDHTRVVFEFDGATSFKTEPVGKNKYKIRIDGCKNIFPTKRSNPTGRDIKSMNFNSGPNRKGLVVTFEVPEGASAPNVETVANPYRMVLSFKATPEALAAIASETPKIVAASGTPPLKNASGTAKVEKTPSTASGTAKIGVGSDKGKPEIAQAKVPEVLPASQPAAIPDITIDVLPASLSRSVFLGRTILIDAGHGGRDAGISIQGLPTEKEITLAVAQKLKQVLKSLGLNAVLVRSKDTDMTLAERNSFVNRSGGDLFISLHAGGSQDEDLEGPACYVYDPTCVSFDQDSHQKLSAQLVYQEWSQSYRFDLAKFMAGKIDERLVQHLSIKDRGVKSLPLLALRFLVIPGALVEVGMLTNPLESRKLASAGYQEAMAKSIANGVIDFFNAIKINQE